tara:strand:+ start:720 stop:1052 length:333 start_codon:yes stop_codon:yes gene_type:complete
MNKLTDLEICKRIAEIEKLPHHLEEGMNDKFINTSTIYGDVCEYNPLTDDALIFNLAFTHKVKIDYFDECVYLANPRTLASYRFNKNEIASLRKAICLAIIETHKELNNG